MNKNLGKMKTPGKLKDIFLIIILGIVSSFLCVMTVKRIKYFSYKEVEATLISHDEITKNTEYHDTCTGVFEYYVDDKKYEASFLIDSQYCFDGYKKTIYYDVNNPNKISGDKSVTMLLIFSFLDLFAIGGLLVMVKDLFKSPKHKKNVNVDNNDGEYKQSDFNHPIYGNYKLVYDFSSVPNKYGAEGTKCLELSFEKIHLDCLNMELEVYLPSGKVNDFFEANQMNKVLDMYHETSSKYLDSIMDNFVNQEISNLSTWYGVPNTSEGKRLIKDKKIITINGFKIDDDSNISKINCSYNYTDDEVATFIFSYDVKNEKIENVDVSS